MGARTRRAVRKQQVRVREAVMKPIGDAFEVPPMVAPGVLAFVNDLRDLNITVIPAVIAMHEGNGDVGRWIDGLPRHRAIAFIEVGSDRLRGMLTRRGYIDAKMQVQDVGPADCMIRWPDA